MMHLFCGFEVAVDDALGVKIFERFDDARHAEPRRHVIKVASTSYHLTIWPFVLTLFGAMEIVP